jgi:SAM-dependent methyltransferase
MVFDAYSRYYDLLYSDKDYVSEASYIFNLINRFSSGAKTVLELGCGSGKHAELLAKYGFHVLGIDASQTMLDQAVMRVAGVAESNLKGSFNAVLGDVRYYSTARTFDAVLSLFHVVSYQTTNEDLSAMLATAARHLDLGGVFIFDVWYGPAVLSCRPETRVKRMEDDRTSVIRIAESQIDINRNVVTVNYTVMVTDKQTGIQDTLTESHRMRYLFQPELSVFANQNGLQIIHSEEWLSGEEPSDTTWGVTFVARRIR